MYKSHKLKLCTLFNYSKNNGFSLGGNGVSELFTNQNKQILNQDSTQSFISKLSEKTNGVSMWDNKAITSDTIQSLAESYDGLDKSFVKCMQDAKANGLSISEATANYEKQGSVVTKLQGSFSAFGDVAGKALATLGNALVSMGISLAASLIIQGIQDLINSYDELVAKVGEITKNYINAQDTLDDYTSKLVNIRTKLEDSSTTTEEAAQMTEELYNIQNDLISTYGAYAAGLDLVNGKLEDQVGILQEINKQNLQQWENEVNAERSNFSKGLNLSSNLASLVTPGSGILASGIKGKNFLQDWLGGKSLKDSVNEYFFGEDWTGNELGNVLGTNLEQISRKWESFSDTIDATDNQKINSIIDSFEEFEVIDGKIKVSGSVDEVSDAVQRLQIQLTDLGYENQSLNSDLVNLSKETQSIIDSSGDTYTTFIYDQIMHSDELMSKYVSLTEAYNEYKAAQDSGDTETAEKALNSYLEVMGDIENSGIEEKYINYFENMHEDLQGKISSWKIEFEIAPQIENSDLEDYIAGNSYEEIFSDYLKWGQEDIDLPNSIENYFDTLSEYADETGISIMQLISLLQQLDNFNYSKAEAKLEKASHSGTGLSSELYEAAKQYYDAVNQYEKVGANKDTFKSGNVKLGEKDNLTLTQWENEDGFKIIYTPYVVDPDTGEEKRMTPQAINQYMNDVLTQATDENGEIDWDLALQIDSENYNMFATGGYGVNLQTYQTEAEAINDRIIAFRNLYNAANDANMTVEEVKSAFNKGLNWDDEQISNFLSGLDEDDLNTFLTLDLDDISKVKTEEELKQLIEDAQEIADENAIEIKTKASESIADLDSMEDSFGDNLSTLYTTTVTNSDKASASEIEDVNSDFGGVTFDEEDISNVNTMSNAIERFNQDLIENAGDSEAAQTSMNKLATAYVDQSGVLDGLLDNLDDITDAEKDYYIQQLKASGITNAEEVVNSRLSKQYQKTSKALTDLSKKIAQNRSALDKGVEAGEEYDTAISNIESSVTDLLTTYNDNGDAIFIPEVDSSFITSNLEDIYAATEGDIDALERLRIAAARANAASVMIDVDLPSEVVESQLDSIMDKVSQVDDMDIEVGAYVEDAQFLSELSNMMSSSQSTANAVAAAFESMGYSVEWKDNPHTITYTEAQISGVEAYSTSAAAAMKQHNVEVNMPSLSIKRTSTGSTGSSVNYGGGTSSSSSSGGGSDSGSDSDSSEDTFDWVEVAISRLESEIERLDEIVDNTYETWGKRNEALKNQIEDVTDEIELQSVAAKRYLAEANSVGLSDEYKKKVQEGTIDIETITDEDLAEDINDYQTYWENYQDAMDQIQTLTFELQGYYKELFEQIESEYDDLLTNIEKKNDIIEERITRTEEHGYFVDKKYYEEQLKLEKQNNDELINERERLVNTMNLAISEGKIKSGSEAWNDMYQSIMDVNKAIEESYTNTVKLNNALRQLKWDAFDWVEERISDVSAEADFLIKILQGELNYEDNGEFTDRGFAQAALVGAKYDDTLKKAQRYRDEILKINEDLAKDPNDKNLVERKEELVQAYRDAIEAAEDEKQAMKSLVEEAINKNLEALQKLIDKYKESLSSAKDLYEYSKNIADQTKNITNLQKQLTALSGDDSEEARKRRQELTNQLDAAEQQLEETEWDRYISETGEMLDDLYSDYEEYLTGKLDYITVLMNDMIKYLNLNGSNVQAGIQEVKDMYDISTLYFEDFGKTSQDMLSSFNNGDFANKLTNISSIIENFKDTMTKVTETSTNGVIKAIEANSVDIKVNSDGTVSITSNGQTATVGGSGGSGSGKTGSKTTTNGGSKTSSGKTGTWKGNSTDGWWYQYSDGSYPKSQWEKIDGKSYYFDPKGYMLADQYVEGYFLGKDGAWDGGSKSSWKSDSGGWWYESADGNYIAGNWALIDGEWYYFDGSGYMVTGKRTIGGKSYTFGTDGKWKGYAKGIRRVPNNQMAWTQENESELIFRSSDGAMLTPLNRGDMVFTAEMSQRLWDFASGNVPRFDNGVPNMRSLSTRNINANNNLTVVLPNVESYDDFKRQLKADKNVEDWMQEITIGRVMGNNTLRKNRY